MPNIGGLLAGFAWLAYRAMTGFAYFVLFVAILGLGICLTIMVMFILVTIIACITVCVKEFYDVFKPHNNGSRDCGNGIAEIIPQDDGSHITEEEAKDSFDEDARTIVDGEIGKSSVELNEKANSEERNPLLRDDGEHTIKEDKESFDENGRKSFEEEHDISFVELDKFHIELR